MIRYLVIELQDSEGNVLYPHTEAGVVFLSNGSSVEAAINSDVTDEDINNIFNAVG